LRELKSQCKDQIIIEKIEQIERIMKHGIWVFKW
jgi:hypothetical protein